LKSNNIIKESFWSFFGQSLSAIAMIAGIRVVTEYITPIHYGQYVVFSGIALLFFNVISGSIFQSFLRIIPEKNEAKALLLSSKLVFLFGGFALSALLISFLFKSYFLFLLFVFFSYLISEHFVGLFKVLMNIKKEQKKYAFFQIFLSVLRPLFSVLLYLYYENNFTSILYGFLLANLLTSFIFFGKNILQDLVKSFGQKFYWNDFYEFFDFAKPLVFQKIFGWCISNADKYIVVFFLGVGATGKYAPIVSLVSMLYLTVNEAINIILRPYYFEYIATNKRRASKKILKIYAQLLFFMSIIFISLFTFFNQQIVSLILGENFREYYYLLPMLSIGFSFLVFGYLFETMCLAYKKTWNVLIIESIAAITNIIILPIMIYNFGIKGIPFAILCTYIAHFISGFILTKKLLKN
tara:strand:+ start:21272 stop:22501 length:1230 start_codon:yes stop_codon:yes gene_type:complete